MGRDTKRTEPCYASAAGRRVRKAGRRRDSDMCVRGMQAWREGTGSRPRAATLVHHKIPYKDRPELGLEMDNLVSLCEICHNQVHAGRGQGAPQADAPHDMAAGVRIIVI